MAAVRGIRADRFAATGGVSIDTGEFLRDPETEMTDLAGQVLDGEVG